MKRWALYLSLCLLALVTCAWSAPVIIQARDYYNADSPTCGIQDAVNALPKEGGQVVLEARTYLMRAPVVLKDDARITGQGTTTLLTRGKEIVHKLAQDGVIRTKTVTVDSAEGYRVGDELAVRDDQNYGWYTTHVIITKIEGNVLSLDTELIRDYAVNRNAIVINHHPMFECYRIWDYRYHTQRFIVEDLVIDGNKAENPSSGPDWSLAAIHLASSANGIIQRVTVRNYFTDAFSDQYGINNTIRDCLADSCRGNGYHPGTSAQGSRFFNNIGINNDGDGFFFCAEVTAAQVIGNMFIGNKHNGIGGLGGGGDRFNIVSNNTCRDNAYNGIQVENGNSNVVTNNVCLNNSTAEAGKYAGISIENSTDTLIMGNMCGTKVKGKDKPAQGYGVLEFGKSDRNIIKNNMVGGNVNKGVQTTGAATVATDNQEPPAEAK